MEFLQEEYLFNNIINSIKKDSMIEFMSNFSDYLKYINEYPFIKMSNITSTVEEDDIQYYITKLKTIPEYAAQYNRLFVLDICNVYNISITVNVSKIAIKYGNLDILEWCRINNKFITDQIIDLAKFHNKTNIIKWCSINKIEEKLMKMKYKSNRIYINNADISSNEYEYNYNTDFLSVNDIPIKKEEKKLDNYYDDISIYLN
jgi:hypothetical protein